MVDIEFQIPLKPVVGWTGVKTNGDITQTKHGLEEKQPQIFT